MNLRNPPWSRDELIIALDLYFQSGRRVLDDHDERIKHTSQILKSIPINRKWSILANFRNENSVCLKLANFRSLDPKHEGKGLQNIGNLDKRIWNEFSEKPDYLRLIAQTIIDTINLPQVFEDDSVDYTDEFIEGRTIERMHKLRERNPKIVKIKKDIAIKDGNLRCSVCGFDFYATYGNIGKGYIECHHKVPLYEASTSKKTKIDDLILVCSNCHSMLHRTRPWLSDQELKINIQI